MTIQVFTRLQFEKTFHLMIKNNVDFAANIYDLKFTVYANEHDAQYLC